MIIAVQIGIEAEANWAKASQHLDKQRISEYLLSAGAAS
jgi:hypothetical protein